MAHAPSFRVAIAIVPWLFLILRHAAAAGTTARDCKYRKGGAFVTFSVYGGLANGVPAAAAPPSENSGASLAGAGAGAAELGAGTGDGIEGSGAEAEAFAAPGAAPSLRGTVAFASAPPKPTPPEGVEASVGEASAYSVTQWVENDDFIDSAIARLPRPSVKDVGSGDGEQMGMIPVFNKVVLGTDCDKQWSWHVDPTDVAGWVDFTTEVCDASPVYLEHFGKEWTESPGRWCPWSVMQVLAVEDRRDVPSGVSKAVATGAATIAGGAVEGSSSVPPP